MLYPFMKIIEELKKAGHEAYIVGGAVRDMLLGLPPNDVDIVTSAVPEEVEEIAEKEGWKALEVGEAFGVVAVVVGGKPYEVATMRKERYGKDSHRPEEVSFVGSIEDDLARRDFTVNAMALDLEGRIIDPFGGRRDMDQRVIRAVGDPYERFAEDGLRMFRAARFSAQLDFTIDPEVEEAAKESLFRVEGLSVERVRDEIEKTLVAKKASRGIEFLVSTGLISCRCTSKVEGERQLVPIIPELARLKGVEQNPRYHKHDVLTHTLMVVDAVPAEPVLRWAALLHDIAKGTEGVRGENSRGEICDCGHEKAGARIAERIMSRLKVKKETARKAAWLIENHMSLPAAKNESAVKWLKKKAGEFSRREELKEAVDDLIALYRADHLGGKVSPDLHGIEEKEKTLKEALEALPFYVSDLAVSGGEVASILGEGAQVGKFMKDVLSRVQSGEIENAREALLSAARKRAQRNARG